MSLAKKISFLFLLFISILIVLLLSFALLFYYKGPLFALSKIKEIAQNQFHTKISFTDAGFINNQGVYIIDLNIKHPDFTLNIHKFKLLTQIHWEKKLLEVKEVILDTVQWDGTIVKKIEDNPISPSKNEPSPLESWIKSPPSYLKINTVKILNLSIKAIFLDQTNPNLEIKKTLSLHLYQIELNSELNKNNLKLSLLAQASPNSIFDATNGLDHYVLALNNLDFKCNQTLQFDNKNQWTLSLSPLEVKMQLKSAKIEKSPDIFLMDQSQLELLLQTNFIFKSLNELDFLKPKDLNWKLLTRLTQIKAPGNKQNILNKKNLNIFLPSSGMNFNLKTEGALAATTPKDQTFQLPWTWKFSLDTQAGPFQFEGTKSHLKLITNWNEDKGSFQLQSTNKTPLSASANLILQKNQLQLKGQIETNLTPSSTEALFGKKLSGKITLPLELSLLSTKNPEIKDVSLNSLITFKNVSYDNNTFSLKNVNGEIPIHEQVFLDLTRLRNENLTFHSFTFKNIYLQNPFEKADFDRLSPLFKSTSPLRIDSIVWKNKNYGPFKGDIELNQNLVSIHKFSIDFLQGSTTGEFFFDFKPKQQRLGFLGRFVDLDLKTLLPDSLNSSTKLETIKSNSPSNLWISARTGLELGLNRRALEGQMDFTQLNKTQLLILINWLDPQYENIQINKIRSLLEYGFPKQVNLVFHDGVVDLKIDIEAMGIKTHFDIPSFSIQKYINQAIPLVFTKENYEDSIHQTQ